MNKTSKSLAVMAIVASFVSAQSATSTFAATSKPVAKPSAKATAKPSAKAIAKPTGIAKPSQGVDGPGAPDGQRGFGGGGAFAALTDTQRACLEKNGFTIPVPPTDAAAPRPSFSPGARPSFSPGARPSGAPGQGRGFGGGNFDPTVMQKAFTACGIAAPQFGNRDDLPNPQTSMKALPKVSAKPVAPANPKQAAFIKCMTAAGVKNSGAALAYDQSDPDTALALIKCQKSSGFTLPKK